MSKERKGWYVLVSDRNANGEMAWDKEKGEHFDPKIEEGVIHTLDVEPIREWEVQRGFIVHNNIFDAFMAGNRSKPEWVCEVSISGKLVESSLWPNQYVGTQREILRCVPAHIFNDGLDNVLMYAARLLTENSNLWEVPHELNEYIYEGVNRLSTRGFQHTLCSRERALKALHELRRYMSNPETWGEYQKLDCDPRMKLITILADASELSWARDTCEHVLTSAWGES